MKTLNIYINEAKHFIKSYSKEKTLDLQSLEEILNDKLVSKEFSCFIENEEDKIKVDITRNIKEGISGHIIEDIIANTISKASLEEFSVKAVKNNGADIIINGEPIEIKSFNSNVRNNGHVEKAIKFTDEQMKSEGFAMILVNYEIDEKIKVKHVYCRYPDEVEWSKTSIVKI